MAISVPPRRTARALLGAVLALGAASVLANLYRHGLDQDGLLGLVNLVNADEEANVPTWLNACLLLLAAALVGIVAGAARARRRHWAALSLLLLYLSMDEVAQVHELFEDSASARLDAAGSDYVVWGIAGAAIVLVLTLVFAGFVRELPARARRRFTFAAALYVVGGLGLDVLGSAYYETRGVDLSYTMLSTAEEVAEMVAVVVLVHAVLDHIRARVGRVSFEVDGAT